VVTLDYHTDNGVYKSTEFMKELASKGQGTKRCGVSAHHKNGAAKTVTKIVQNKARSMMIHAAICWPGFSEKNLWPMALSHAAYLHNHTPSADLGWYSPIEIMSQTKSDHHALQSAHVWGCPVYVLHPRL
jgi:hypothetical protein